MKSFGAGLLVISGLYAGSAWAGPDAGLAAHRAAYELSLADAGSSGPPGAQTPVAATGLIAYEFRGSACEGYASNFRQLTRVERQEGEPIASDPKFTVLCPGNTPGGVAPTSIVPEVAVNEFAASVAVMV